MATPKGFGDRMHFETDGCDDDSIRHRMGMQANDLQRQVFRKPPVMGNCYICGDPVMEEEFDCGKHGVIGG